MLLLVRNFEGIFIYLEPIQSTNQKWYWHFLHSNYSHCITNVHSVYNKNIRSHPWRVWTL